MRVVPLTIGDAEILFEVTQTSGSERTGRLGEARDRIIDAAGQMDKVIETLADCSIRAMQNSVQRARKPISFEIEFGLKFSAEGNIIVASATGEASLKIKLVYDGNMNATRESDDDDG